MASFAILKTKQSRRRFFLVLFILAIALPLVFLGVVNSKPVKGKLIRTLKNKTGVQVHFDRIYPVGFSQIQLSNVEAENFSVSQVTVDLNVAQSLRRRKPSIKGLIIEEPEVHLKLEKLIATTLRQLKNSQKTPLIAQNTSTPTITPAIPQATSGKTSQPVSPTPSAPKKQAPPNPVKKPRPLPYIEIRNAKISGSYNRFPAHILELNGIHLSTKDGKLNNSGHLKIADLTLNSKDIPLGLTQSFTLEKGSLIFPETPHTIGNTDIPSAFQLSNRLWHSLAIKVEQTQPITGSYQGLQYRINSAEALVQSRGNFRSIPSLQAVAQMQTGAIDIQYQGHQQSFDRSKLLLTLKQGSARCEQLSIISDHLSLMSNGYYSSRLGGKGVVRLVMDDVWADRLGRLKRTQFKDEPPLSIQELDTPDRLHQDIYIQAFFTDYLRYSLNDQKSWSLLNPLITKLTPALKNE